MEGLGLLTIEGLCKGEKRGRLRVPQETRGTCIPQRSGGATVVTHGGDRGGWNALQCRGKQGRHRRGGRLSTGGRSRGTSSVNTSVGTMSAGWLDRLPPQCRHISRHITSFIEHFFNKSFLMRTQSCTLHCAPDLGSLLIIEPDLLLTSILNYLCLLTFGKFKEYAGNQREHKRWSKSGF